MPETLGWIAYHALRTPHRTALIDLATERSFDYRQLEDRVSRLASALRSSGLKAGDRLAILSYNSTNVFEIFHACCAIGVIAVPLNWRLSDRELRGLVNDCSPAGIMSDSSLADRAAMLAEHGSMGFSLVWGTPADDDYESAIAGAPRLTDSHESTSATPLVIIYTSGTTGEPKGVVHTIGSVIANMQNSAFAGEISSDSVCLTVLPTFHVAGLHLFPNAAIMHGGTVVVLPVFEPEQTLTALSSTELGVTHFCGVPAIFQFMSKSPAFDTADFADVLCAVGGAPVPDALLRQWSSRGVRMMSVYGITEAGSTVLAMPPRAVPDEATAVGIPAVHAECAIRSSDGHDLPAGDVGELWIRGPMLAAGYWERSADTAAAIVDGWLKSGDAAKIDDDGFVHIVDRWKDMYISGGENVYPAEIENVLYQHADVVLASVIGVDHERWGESGVAFMVLSEGATCTPDELRQWCRDRLAGYKVPTEFRIVEDLPRNATGKIMKNQLRSGAR